MGLQYPESLVDLQEALAFPVALAYRAAFQAYQGGAAFQEENLAFGAGSQEGEISFLVAFQAAFRVAYQAAAVL